ncbi:MAG TPA: hypothetical protein VFZ21_29895 [Gemmatimonadaceae bacterium]|nr:hypothetical protein [Gemmatimonadaceae bacterium]
MDTLLFSGRSIWTMVHGIVLGGGAMLGLAAALFYLGAMRHGVPDGTDADHHARWFAGLTLAIAVLLWFTVIVGTYVTFPPYRAAPPEGATDLVRYPRSMLLANPETRWLHAFAMEVKEHVPWVAAMLATAVAYVAVTNRTTLQRDADVRRIGMTLLAICFVLVAGASLLGVFVNKVAPLE